MVLQITLLLFFSSISHFFWPLKDLEKHYETETSKLSAGMICEIIDLGFP